MTIKKLLTLVIAVSASSAFSAPPPGYCEVRVCNKLERFTLDPWKMVKDGFGEVCQPALLGQEDAVVGKVLTSSSRWYQGSFNPTKKSVTRVKQVLSCTSVPKALQSLELGPKGSLVREPALQLGPTNN